MFSEVMLFFLSSPPQKLHHIADKGLVKVRSVNVHAIQHLVDLQLLPAQLVTNAIGSSAPVTPCSSTV